MIYNFLQKKGWYTIWITTLIVTIVFAFNVDYTKSSNELNGLFAGVIMSSFTAITSCVAFFVVVSAEKSKWGEVIEFRTYFAIGALIATVSSLLQLFSAFT